MCDCFSPLADIVKVLKINYTDFVALQDDNQDDTMDNEMQMAAEARDTGQHSGNQDPLDGLDGELSCSLLLVARHEILGSVLLLLVNLLTFDCACFFLLPLYGTRCNCKYQAFWSVEI